MKLPFKKETEQQKKTRDYISYSELKIWNECSYRHRLAYVENRDHFTSNEFTVFGTAIHAVCEEIVPDPNKNPLHLFESSFNEEIKNLTNPDNVLFLLN